MTGLLSGGQLPMLSAKLVTANELQIFVKNIGTGSVKLTKITILDADQATEITGCNVQLTGYIDGTEVTISPATAASNPLDLDFTLQPGQQLRIIASSSGGECAKAVYVRLDTTAGSVIVRVS